MNLGIERFLVLGCIGVAILELPHVLDDLRHRDGYPAFVQAHARALAAAEAADASAAPSLALRDHEESELLTRLVAEQPLDPSDGLAVGAGLPAAERPDGLKRLDELLPSLAGL